MKKRNIYILIGLLLILGVFLVPDFVLAKTSSDIQFCDYGETRRTFQIAGIIINIAKVVVPVIIVIMGSIAFVKPIISGKVEDIKSSAITLMKQCIAGIIVFFIPTIIDFSFNLYPDYDETTFADCTDCLFDPDHCTIPDTNPDTYIED